MMLSKKSSSAATFRFSMQKNVWPFFPHENPMNVIYCIFFGASCGVQTLPIHMFHGFVFSQERMSRVYHFATTDLVPCSLVAKKRYYKLCHNGE